MTWDEPLQLRCGAALGPITLAYETYGALNAQRDNAVLVMHTLTGDAHAAGLHHPDDARPGWWDALIGPGRGLDTTRYFVICVNVIGGCGGSTGPSSIDPATDRPYGMRFPMVTIPDMVAAQMRLLDRLGIRTLHGAIGGSMGGMQVLELAINHPDRVRTAIMVASPAKHSAQAIAFNYIGRQAIMSDPNWRGGDYYGHQPPADGLATARRLAHMTYLSADRLQWRFGRDLQEGSELGYTFAPEMAIESYLSYQGDAFTTRFDANSYLYITKALDYFDPQDGYPSLAAAAQQAQARFLIASYSSDWLYPPHESEALAEVLAQAGHSVQYVALESPLGHDAFLLEYREFGPLVAAALASG
jgi:homoserine O-acetyltransferase